MLFAEALPLLSVVVLLAGTANAENMSVDKYIGKSYTLSKSDNFEDFLKKIGVGLFTRKIANNLSPTLVLTKEGDEYVISQTSTFKNMIVRFKPNVEFDQETPDGRTVKSIITLEGNKFHEVQNNGPNTDETVIDRVWGDDEVHMTMHNGDVKATRIYKLDK